MRLELSLVFVPTQMGANSYWIDGDCGPSFVNLVHTLVLHPVENVRLASVGVEEFYRRTFEL